MNCIYKIGDKEYTLEELQKFLDKTTVGEVENKQTSPTNPISQNVATIGVRSNPPFTQEPFKKTEDQIVAYPILNNGENSVQVGTQLVLTKGTWKGQTTYELHDKNGVYIGNLKDADKFKFENEELRNRYKARLALLDNQISTTSGQVLIDVTGKSEGIPLNMNEDSKLSDEEKHHSVDSLIGDDTQAKLVNISSTNGKDFTISLDGKEVPLAISGYDVDTTSLVDMWKVIAVDGKFRSMLLLPTPVRTTKGIFYKLLPTTPTKIFSTINAKTQFPEFVNTVKTVLNAIKNKNFDNVSSIGVTDNKSAVTFLNKFFMNVQLIKRTNGTAVQFGTGTNSTVGAKFDIESKLKDINTVLTYTPENETITLLNESGEEVKFSYKTISQKLHTTTYNYSTAIEGQPRTYFSNPQVALDLKNPKVNTTVTSGNEPSKTTKKDEIIIDEDEVEKSKKLIYDLIADKAKAILVDKNGESAYSFLNKIYKRVSNYIGNTITFDKVSSVTNLSNSVVVGDYFDTLGRMFFNNENVTIEEFKEALKNHSRGVQFDNIHTENIFESSIAKFKNIKQLIKQQLKDENLTFIADEIFVHQTFKTSDGFDGIAGTLDMVVIDSKGKIHIYDFKTSSENTSITNEVKLNSTSYGPSTISKWSNQQSAYSQLISNTFGYNPDINIIVIPVTYKQEVFKGDYTNPIETSSFKPLPYSVKISSNLFLQKLNYTKNNRIPNFTPEVVSQPVTEAPIKKPLKGKGSERVELNDDGTSKALDIDQINSLIDLAKNNKLQSTLDLVKSLANELSSDLLKGMSFQNSKNRIKEQLQDNLERAETLSTPEGLEEHFNDIDDYEKNIDYNKQVVIDVTNVLENFDKFFENAGNLLQDSGFTQKEGTYLEPEFDKDNNDVIPDEDEEQSVDDQGTSEKIHTKTSLEYNPFYEMDGKVKAFLNTISKEMASFLNMNASYGAEQLFSEIADLVVVNEVNTTEDFKSLVQKQYDKTNAYHLKDFLWKFNRLTTENQNGIVKSFSLTKNRLVGTKGGNVFDSNRNDRYLQLKDFLDNRFKELFLNEDESVNKPALEEFREYIISLQNKTEENYAVDTADLESVLSKLGFGLTLEQKQQVFKIFIAENHKKDFYSQLKIASNQVLSGDRTVEFMSQNILKSLSTNGFESIMFSNRGTVIVNKDGNKIYIYSVPNNNAEINKRASYYKGLLQQNPFSKLSTLAEKLEKGTAKPIYMDGVEDKGFSKLNTVQKLHARATFFFKSVFNGEKNYPFFSSAKSDKVPVDGLEVPKIDYIPESAKGAFLNLLRVEKARMVNFDTNKPNVKGYKPNFFYLFPELNKGGEFDLEFQNGDKVDFSKITEEILNDVAKKLINKYYLISKHQLRDYKLNGNPLTQEEILNLMTNEMVNNYEYMATYSNDPAWAGKKTLKDTFVNYFKRLASDIATGQRVPNLAPSTIVVLPDDVKKSSNFEQILERLDKMTMEQFNVLLSEDELNKNTEGYESKVKKLKSYPYSEINSADAQGYMSLKRYVHILHNQNKLSLDKFNRIIAEINKHKGADIANLVLENDLLEDVLIQALKPVIIGNQMKNGAMVRHYVKLSSFPLLPQLYTKEDKCMDYIKFMHENSVDNIVFESAYKVGSPEHLPDLKDYNPEKHLSTLDSHFFGIQQEVPYDENKTLLLQGSQILKLLFNDISKPELKSEFYKIQSDLVNNFLEDLKTKLGITLTQTGNPEVDFAQLQKTLIKEFKKKGLNPQDIENFNITDNGTDFNIPLFFNKLGGKIESTIFNMFKKMSKTKLGGKSYVLVSDHGFSGINPKIKTTSSYDASKGLQPMRIDKETGKVLPAQIMITWDMQDSEGNILNIEDFSIDGKVNMELLPKELLEGIGYRIPTQGHNSMSYVEIVGFLPKYMGSTVIASKDFVAQMGSDFDIDKLYLHKKTYKFIKHSEKYKGKGVGRFIVEGSKVSDKIETEPAVYEQTPENRLIDIYKEVLSSPDVFDKVISPLGFGNLPKVAKELSERADKEYLDNKNALVKTNESLQRKDLSDEAKDFLIEEKNELLDKIYEYEIENSMSILHPSVQNNNYEVGTAGKDCVGRSSLLSVFSAIVQNSGLKIKEYREFTDMNDNVTSFGFKPKVQIGNKEYLLGSLDSSESLIKTPDSIEETENDVISAFQSAAVDNAKELLLKKVNYSVNTHNILTGMVKLRLDSQFISYFLTHPIIKNNKDGKFESKISINDVHSLSYDRLKEVTEDDYVVEAYAKFFHNLGKEINGVSSGLNITSKGYGASLEELETTSRLIPDGSSEYLDNTNAVYKLPYFSIGLANIGMVRSFTNKIFGLNKETIKSYRDLISENAIKKSGPKVKVINNFFKSFVYNQATHFIKGDIDGIRNKLFYGKNSLQNRLIDLKRANPDEVIFKYLTPLTVSQSNKKSPKLIRSELFSITSDLDKLQWQIAFEEAYFDTNSPYNSFVRDMVSYTYLMGGIQDANSIVSSIPSTVIRDFQEGLYTDKLLESETKANNAAVQFFQHNPNYINIDEPYTGTDTVDFGDLKSVPKIVKFIEVITSEDIRVYVGWNTFNTQNVDGSVSAKYRLYETKGENGIKEITPSVTNRAKRLEVDNVLFENLRFETGDINTIIDSITSSLDSNNPIGKNFKFLQEVLNAQGNNIKVVASNLRGIDRGTYKDGVITLYSDNIKSNDELLEVLLHEMTHSIIDRYLTKEGTKTAPKEIQDVITKLKRFQRALAELAKNDTGTIQNLVKLDFKEFVPYVISNPKVQTWMNTYKVNQEKSPEGFWDRFAGLLKELVTKIANSLGIVKLDDNSFATIALNEIENLLNVTKTSSELLKNNQDYIDKVKGDWEQVKLKAFEEGLLPQNLKLDTDKEKHVIDNKNKFESIVNEVVDRNIEKPLETKDFIILNKPPRNVTKSTPNYKFIEDTFNEQGFKAAQVKVDNLLYLAAIAANGDIMPLNIHDLMTGKDLYFSKALSGNGEELKSDSDFPIHLIQKVFGLNESKSKKPTLNISDRLKNATLSGQTSSGEIPTQINFDENSTSSEESDNYELNCGDI